MDFQQIHLLVNVNFADAIILKPRGRYAKGVTVILQSLSGMGPDGIGFRKSLPRFFRQFEGAIHDLRITNREIAIIVNM
jgi:hypothetical protein